MIAEKLSTKISALSRTVGGGICGIRVVSEDVREKAGTLIGYKGPPGCLCSPVFECFSRASSVPLKILQQVFFIVEGNIHNEIENFSILLSGNNITSF